MIYHPKAKKMDKDLEEFEKFMDFLKDDINSLNNIIRRFENLHAELRCFMYNKMVQLESKKNK